MKIAIVGTGIAGLGAGYALSRAHEVELFEARGEPGGHTRTLHDRGRALDTGFIVHNEPNYPELAHLFRELGIRTQPSEMSFSVECACGVAWSSRRPWRAGPRLLAEILRFLRTADRADSRGRTVDELVDAEGYSDSFRWHYLVPMTAAIWSSPPGSALRQPAEFVLEFFRHHGMLGLRRHRWRTVVGGSETYVRAVLDRIGGQLHTDLRVRSVARTGGQVELRAGDEPVRHFDAAVIATPAPEALRILADPTEDERRLLGVFRTTTNESVLHTDARMLPRRTGDLSAWNYRSPGCGVLADLPTVTYSLNRLQRLSADRQYCVTLNRTAQIDAESVIATFADTHPQMTPESVGAQAELPTLNGPGNTAFAGAWQGYGFHEDGLVSGLRAARAIGGDRS